MTNSEAVMRIEALRLKIDPPTTNQLGWLETWIYKQDIEALEMAIKALEIVREFEAALIITGGRLNGRTYAYKKGLEDGKRKALEQEPKTGHWLEMIVEIDSFGNGVMRHECSVCGNTDSGWGEYKYCPNCGAKMVPLNGVNDVLGKAKEEIREYCEKNCMDGDIVANELSLIIDKYRQEG